MCHEDSEESCTDQTALKGYISVITEFVYLQRSVSLKSSSMTSEAIFNDDDYYHYGIIRKNSSVAI